jgi:hypothetical protein
MLDGDPCGWPAGDGGKVTSMHGPASDEPRRPYVPMALVFFCLVRFLAPYVAMMMKGWISRDD